MAISTNTFTINSGYTKQQMITQIESAFTWLGWHDKCDHTGIVTGLVDYGMYQDDDSNNSYVYYQSGEQTSTTGIGTGASFYMQRYAGNPQYVYVNKPGYGYTNGEYLSFVPGEMSIKESGIGWGCTVYVDPVSYGTTHNGFYAKNIDAGNSYPYGVLRHKIQDNKKYGVTSRDLSILKIRMDEIPVSLAIAQAAKETGWGTSRFAQEGNALFGQWTWSGEGLRPKEAKEGQEHKVMKFNILQASVRAYQRNLNTHSTYKDFRKARAKLRDANKKLDSMELSKYLNKYAETGNQYVEVLQKIIKQNKLQDFDDAKLLPSSVDLESLI